MALFLLLLPLMCTLVSSSFLPFGIPFNPPPQVPSQTYNAPALYPALAQGYDSSAYAQAGSGLYNPPKSIYGAQPDSYSNQYVPEQQLYPSTPAPYTSAPFFKPFSFWNIFPKFSFFNPTIPTPLPYTPSYSIPYPKPYGYPQPPQQVEPNPYGYPQPPQQVETGYVNQGSYQMAKPQYEYTAAPYAPAPYAPTAAPASYNNYPTTQAPVYTYTTTKAPYAYRAQSAYSTTSKSTYEVPTYNQQSLASRSSGYDYKANLPMYQEATYNAGVVVPSPQPGNDNKTVGPVENATSTTVFEVVTSTQEVPSNYTQNE